MDITNFVVQGRDKALLYGDYSSYHAQLSKRILSTRKKLGTVTKNRGKFQKKDEVKAQDIAQNHENVHLLLLTSERAWAQAMSIKAAHTANQKGIRGRTRSHVVSRLDKAARDAEHLVQILSESDVSGASANDILEARAYASLIRGAMQFEKHTWGTCLKSYAIARIIYSALATSFKGDIFKDLLAETIDPSIRYAAYQLKTPRTIPIPVVARNAFPQDDKFLTTEVNRIDPKILKQGGADSDKDPLSADGIPRTLTWRSREVRIEDAQISEAWASVQNATSRLADRLAAAKTNEPQEIAGAYDEILTATQDAVDATKQAIDEMRGEGVAQSDPRMQSLQITRTVVNYEMVSWRIGRNRVLTGAHDGATEEYGSLRRRRKAKATQDVLKEDKEWPATKKLAKLKEKAALYDGTLQNLESIKELPGVAADVQLAARIEAFERYFLALKSLSIARSHAIIGNAINALALIQNSCKLCAESASKLPESTSTTEAPLNVDVAPDAVKSLQKLLDGELQRHRAIVHIENLQRTEIENAADASTVPLIERLHEYPAGGVDLKTIVEFPPKMALIPMKPILLDVAWNYIQYPGKAPPVSAANAASKADSAKEPEQQQQKRGWFGFGRS